MTRSFVSSFAWSLQVLFVHHYISDMHELAHTVARHAPGPNNADAGADGCDHNRGEGEVGKNGTTPRNTAGGPATPCSGNGKDKVKDRDKENDNENGKEITRAEDIEGLGGLGPQPTLTQTSAKAAVEGAVGTQEPRRRMYYNGSRGPGEPGDEQHSGSLGDVSRRTNASDVSTFCMYRVVPDESMLWYAVLLVPCPVHLGYSN